MLLDRMSLEKTYVEQSLELILLDQTNSEQISLEQMSLEQMSLEQMSLEQMSLEIFLSHHKL